MALAKESPLVVLFDVDGTLVLTGGAGRRAMRRAFAEVHGDASYLEAMDLRGMTDQGILIEACEGSGVAPTKRAIDDVLERYLGLLAEEVAASSGYAIMPGVHALIDALRSQDGTAVGIGTGNVRAAAEIKLVPSGLNAALRFGGFGCDARDRADLLRVGFERGAELLNAPVDECVRVVVGDTPRDVIAASRVGATTLAVCTGGHSAQDLRAAGASWVVEDLEDPSAFDHVLGLRSGEVSGFGRTTRARGLE